MFGAVEKDLRDLKLRPACLVGITYNPWNPASQTEKYWQFRRSRLFKPLYSLEECSLLLYIWIFTVGLVLLYAV